MSESDPPVVLIIEDEPDVAESYELMLGDDYDVRIANNGEAGLELVADADVVLLDRMLPGMSGTEVLKEIRNRDVDVRVAMVTAVDPDFDVIEMGFDDYVQKPPTDAELRATIDDLLERGEYEDDVQDYYSLLARKGSLEAEKTEKELEESTAYHELERRIQKHQADLAEENDLLLDDTAFVGALRDLTGGPGEGVDG